MQLRLAQFFLANLYKCCESGARPSAPVHLSNLNSITSPIIVEAVGVIPCLLRIALAK